MRFWMMFVALVGSGCDNKVPTVSDPGSIPVPGSDTGIDDDTGIGPADDTGGADPDDTGGEPDPEDAIVVGYSHGTDLLTIVRYMSTGSMLEAQNCHIVIAYQQQVAIQYIPADADVIHMGAPEVLYNGCTEGTIDFSQLGLSRIGFAGDSVLLMNDEGWQHYEFSLLNSEPTYIEESGFMYTAEAEKGDTYFLWNQSYVDDDPEHGAEWHYTYVMDWGTSSAGEYRPSAVFVETMAITDESPESGEPGLAEEAGSVEREEREEVCLQVTNFAGWPDDELTEDCEGCDDSATFTGRLAYNDCGDSLPPYFSDRVYAPETYGFGMQTDPDALLIRDDSWGDSSWMPIEEHISGHTGLGIDSLMVREENTFVWSADVDWADSNRTHTALHLTWR